VSHRHAVVDSLPTLGDVGLRVPWLGGHGRIGSSSHGCGSCGVLRSQRVKVDQRADRAQRRLGRGVESGGGRWGAFAVGRAVASREHPLVIAPGSGDGRAGSCWVDPRSGSGCQSAQLLRGRARKVLKFGVALRDQDFFVAIREGAILQKVPRSADVS